MLPAKLIGCRKRTRHLRQPRSISNRDMTAHRLPARASPMPFTVRLRPRHQQRRPLATAPRRAARSRPHGVSDSTCVGVRTECACGHSGTLAAETPGADPGSFDAWHRLRCSACGRRGRPESVTRGWGQCGRESPVQGKLRRARSPGVSEAPSAPDRLAHAAPSVIRPLTPRWWPLAVCWTGQKDLHSLA